MRRSTIIRFPEGIPNSNLPLPISLIFNNPNQSFHMPHRVFADDALTAETLELDEQEARHLRDVMRIKVGDVVEVFNGKGVVAQATVSKAAKRCVELNLQSRQSVEYKSSGITIAAAIPKGDRFRWMIEKLSELNVERFIPLTTSRSVVSPGDSKLKRMRQVVIAAAKQCRRNDLMAITPVIDWPTAVTEWGPKMLLADPVGKSVSSAISSNGEVVFAIGPEGGFSPKETQLALDAGASNVRFGDTILRIETAAIAAATIGSLLLSDSNGRSNE